MKPIKRIICALTAASVLSAGAFSLCASADDDGMDYKITYSTKYTYLELTPSDKDNVIRYTTDGSVPDENSKEYYAKIRTAKGVTIRAAEFDENGEKVDRLKIKLKRKCMKPEISSAKTEDGFEISLSDKTEDVVIYYTTDGSKPDTDSQVYDGAFTVEKGTVIRAYAVKEGWKSSAYLKVTVKKGNSSAYETAETASAPEYDSMTLKILDLVNEYREEEGLPALEMDEQLYEAANIRARELTELYSHSRPDGRTCFTVFDEVGFDRCYGGENIAYTEGELSTAKTIMQLWMDSPDHRDNILNTKGSRIGIGYYTVGNRTYWVQLFGERR